MTSLDPLVTAAPAASPTPVADGGGEVGKAGSDAAPAFEHFPVVGAGGGAGAVEAFADLLDHLPVGLGIALVLVLPRGGSGEDAVAALARRTAMPVVAVTTSTPMAPDHVYVASPEFPLTVRGGALVPTTRGESEAAGIDPFLAALAADFQNCAIGLILSGAGADGVFGLREIKSVGGISLVQEPATARDEGMPRAAIAAGMVDLVLSPARVAEELQRIGRHPYVRSGPARRAGDDLVIQHEQLHRIFALLRRTSGVDFSNYKPPTIRRRLHRRMVLRKIDGVEQYIGLLHSDPEEVTRLYQDILIHVTRFFRDPGSFAALQTLVFPELLRRRSETDPVRIWLPGCSTGEEAYSVAIAMLEFLGEEANAVPIQIFATDVSEAAIDHARAGLYPEAIAADLTPERLRRFFTLVDGRYRIARGVRDLCIFARQDITRDPPFSKLDLILCRNVLIYLGAVLQHKLMSVFHYALRPSGFLVLGGAETIGTQVDLFSVLDKKHRIFIKKRIDTPLQDRALHESMGGRTAGRGPRPAGELQAAPTFQSEANRLVLDRYGPSGVIVDGEFQVVQFRGKTGDFLEPAAGDVAHGHNVLKMAREGLLHGLQTALYGARKTDGPVRKTNLRVQTSGGGRDVDLQVIPFSVVTNRYYLALFEDAAAPASAAGEPEAVDHGDDERVKQLQEELTASREYLQSIIQDLEVANEELQSANEEILSSNEELQSTNEELDTAKEELQSSNEEFSTVNEEVQRRNEELGRANSDLVNLLGSVEIAIVIVGADLRIRRFTTMAGRLMNLIPTDVGRPIGQVKPDFEHPDLTATIARVIETATIHEASVRDSEGRWYSLRIRPYTDLADRVDGAVLALFDIAVRQPPPPPHQLRDDARVILEGLSMPVVVLDEQLNIRGLNRPFCGAFHVDPAAALRTCIYDLAGEPWGGPGLRTLLAEVLPRDGRAAAYPLGGEAGVVVDAARVDGGEPGAARIVLTVTTGPRG